MSKTARRAIMLAASEPGFVFDQAFVRWFKKLVGHEGGYVYDPDDAGKRTIYGVSERAHPDMWIDGPPSYNSCKALYYAEYWKGVGADNLPEWHGQFLADGAVNMGLVRASKQFQKALNWCGENLVVDGKIGPATVRAFKRQESKARLVKLWKSIRISHYTGLATRKPSQAKFIWGWVKRTWNY